MDLSININNFRQAAIIIKEDIILEVNDNSLKLLRAVKREDLIGKSIFNFIYKDHIENASNYFKSIEENNQDISEIIIRLNCLDGTTKRFEISSQIINYDGEKSSLLILREIEEYIKTFDELKEKEEILNAVYNASFDLILVINNKKIIIDYFTSDYSILYTSPDNFLGKSIFHSLPDYCARLTNEKVDKVLSTGIREEYEYYLTINDQKRYYVCNLVKKNETEVLAIVRNITTIKQVEHAFEEELKFKSILNYLSMKFINCEEDEVDLVINNTLSEVGKYFEVDRVYIFEFDSLNNQMSNTYEWCANDITPEIDNLQKIDNNLFPDFVIKLLNKELIIIDNVKECEDENLKNILELQGILSLIISPIFIKSDCFGFVGFDSVKSFRKFSEKEIYFLNLFSNFLSNIFQRIKKENELKKRKKELESSRKAYLNLIDDLTKENVERKKIEQELILSEQKFRSYVEQTKGIIYVINRDGKFSYVSPSVKDILGVESEKLVGKSYTSLVHSEDIKIVLSQLKEIIKTLKPIKSVPIRLKNKSSSYIWVVIQSGPLLDQNGSIKEFIGVAVDVNELIEVKQQLSLLESRYQSLFENLIEAYVLHEIILDENGIPIDYRFIDVNKAFLELTGLTNKKEIVGKTLLEVWPNIEKDWIQFYGEIALSGGKQTIEKFSPAFNKTFHINVYSQEKQKFAVSFFDITDRKKSEITKKIQLNIADAIIQEIDLSALLITIKNELSQLIDTTNFFVAKYNENNKLFTNLIFIDERDEADDFWSAEDSLSGYVINKKTPMLLKKNEIVEIEKLIGKNLVGTIPEILVGVPIILKGKSLGIMVVQSYTNPNAYDQSTVDLLQTIASQLAVFIEQKEFESQIRLLSRAIEQSSAIVIITDKDNKIQFVNKKFYQITGFSEHEVIGNRPNICKSNFHTEDFYQKMWNDISLGKDWTGEILNKDKFGKTFWVSAIISPIIGQDGKISNYIAIEEDITERKKLQQKIETSEKQLRTTWEYSIDGMRLTDENGIIIDVNPALCKMYGVDKKNFIGKPFYYMIKNYSGGGLKVFRDNIISGKIDKVKEYNLELDNGKNLNVEITNSVIKFEDGKNYLFSIFRDITEKKNMINDLIAAKEKAEEMSRIKSQFFANMSHELRTPFMGILGYTELLRDKVNDDEGHFFLDGISKSSNRMIETLTNILDITKFETGKVELKKEQVDIEFTILEVCEHFKYQANKKNILLEKSIILPKAFKLLTDIKLIRSILNNLVSNAIKFTNEGKVILSSYLKNSNLIIEVKDTGIGIPKEKQKIIFDEFRQVSEGHARAFEGTGLGLSIAKKSVELLGGSIKVESELNKGSKFTISFPI